MTEAENADRASGVWELAPDKWEPGDMVQIEGLKSRADLNGTTGVLIKWNPATSRWAVTVLASDEKVKVRPANLCRVDAAEAMQVVNAEAAVRTAVPLPSSAGASVIAAQLAAEQYVVVDDFLQSGGGAERQRCRAAAVRDLLVRLRGQGELQQGEVAGGRAAALEARILGRPLPRGDLMRFLEPGEVVEHSVLVELLGALDALIEQLVRAPALAEEMVGCAPLRREEVQLTCYPGDGTQYIEHIDNNEGRGGRHITAIYYANLDWKTADGGALRLHTRSGEAGGQVDVPPMANRLVCFWSNRVPHSVQPSHADRYAVSAWYHKRQ